MGSIIHQSFTVPSASKSSSPILVSCAKLALLLVGAVAVAAALKLTASIEGEIQEEITSSVPDSLSRRWEAKDGSRVEPGLTFDPPVSYSGPEVPGWPPGKSRDLVAYVRPGRPDTVLVGGDTQCQGGLRDKEIVVFVQSAPKFRNRRDSIRRTWARRSPSDIAVLFVMGGGGLPQSSMALLRAEEAAKCDLLLDDFVDSYSNTTLDTMAALKFFLSLQREDERGGGPSLVMIADDDSYVDLRSLRKKLIGSEEQTVKRDSSAIWGMRYRMARPHFPEPKLTKPHQDLPRHRWTYTPTYMFNGAAYPDYPSGAGYAMGAGAARRLYRSALALPFFHVNDVLVGGFARARASLRVRHDPEAFVIDPDWGNEEELARPEKVVFHRVEPKRMRRLFEIRRKIRNGPRLEENNLTDN